MERLGEPLRAELERLAPASAELLQIVRAWPSAVGETVARNAWPARMRRDGTLVVHASSATWAFELGRLADDVLDRLRAALPEAAPARLRFQPGPLPEPAVEAPRRGVETTPADAAAASALVACVDDDELREVVRRAAAASLARSRAETGSDRGF